jgi:hypothetical protein
METAAAREAGSTAARAEEKAKAAAHDAQAWFDQSTSAKPVAHRSGIGRYIAPQHLRGVAAAAEAGTDALNASDAALPVAPKVPIPQPETIEPPKKKARAFGGFGNFDGW